MKKLRELNSIVKGIIESDTEKKIPITDYRQSVIYQIAQLLTTMQIRLLEANKTNFGSKSYKDNLNALETLNLAFVLISDLKGENDLLRNELVSFKFDAEYLFNEMSERIKTLEMIDDL